MGVFKHSNAHYTFSVTVTNKFLLNLTQHKLQEGFPFSAVILRLPKLCGFLLKEEILKKLGPC